MALEVTCAGRVTVLSGHQKWQGAERGSSPPQLEKRNVHMRPSNCSGSYKTRDRREGEGTRLGERH